MSKSGSMWTLQVGCTALTPRRPAVPILAEADAAAAHLSWPPPGLEIRERGTTVGDARVSARL